MNNHEYISEGVEFARVGDFDKARESFEKAIDCDPNFARSWHNLANTYFHQDRWAASLQFFKKAIELDPLLEEPYLTAGLALANMGLREDALRLYDKGLKALPGSPALWYNKAYSLVELKKIPEAIAAYDIVLSLDPRDRDAAYNRDILLKSCKFVGFCQVFESDGPDLIEKRAEIYSINGIMFVTLSIDNPGLPLNEEPEFSIHYDADKYEN